MRADASGALRRKPQLSSAERHRLSARGGGGSRHPKGSQFSCLLTSCKPSAKKVRPRARPPAPAHAVAALRGRRCFAPRLDRQNCSARNLAIPSCGPDARRNFAKKSPAFACRAAPEPAVARRLARATLRVAIVQLDARLQTINRESSAHRPPYGPDCCSKTAICDRAPLRRPPRRAQLRCCSAGYGAVSEKEPRPTVSGRTPPTREGRTASFAASLYHKRPLPGVQPETWLYLLASRRQRERATSSVE